MNRRLARCIALALALGAAAVQAAAAPRVEPFRPPRATTVQADCYAIGQQVAAEQGGTLARATPASQGGQTVCIIVVLMPARDGQHPRRAEFVVPAR